MISEKRFSSFLSERGWFLDRKRIDKISAPRRSLRPGGPDRPLHTLISRILRGRQADVEELTADVFLAAWDNREKLRAGQVKGYLGAIARNRAFNLLRSDRENLPLEDDVLILETDGPDKELDRKETARIVNKALAQLDKPQRELFVRHYYYGQTVQEAALAMGLNLSTAKTWLRRGRETLKTYLRKEGYEYETAGNFQADG